MKEISTGGVQGSGILFLYAKQVPNLGYFNFDICSIFVMTHFRSSVVIVLYICYLRHWKYDGSTE